MRSRFLFLVPFSWLMLSFWFPKHAQAQSWRFADNSSAGIAPSAAEETRAVVQVYAARTVRWRGHFAVHSWIATKPENGTEWTTYHVIGWRQRRGEKEVVAVTTGDVPDRRWYGAMPFLIDDVRGERAAAAIPKIEAASKTYPYAQTYRAWPGPNSNTPPSSCRPWGGSVSATRPCSTMNALESLNCLCSARQSVALRSWIRARTLKERWVQTQSSSRRKAGFLPAAGFTEEGTNVFFSKNGFLSTWGFFSPKAALSP